MISHTPGGRQATLVGMQRGWVGHQREHKWFTVVAGEVQVDTKKVL